MILLKNEDSFLKGGCVIKRKLKKTSRIICGEVCLSRPADKDYCLVSSLRGRGAI